VRIRRRRHHAVEVDEHARGAVVAVGRHLGDRPQRQVDPRAVLEEHQPRVAATARFRRRGTAHEVGPLEDRPLAEHVDPGGIGAKRFDVVHHEHQVVVAPPVGGRGGVGARTGEDRGAEPRVGVDDGEDAVEDGVVGHGARRATNTYSVLSSESGSPAKPP
jgi:hypothetical protein